MRVEPNRRGFLLGMGAILAAPAIVRVASLMPVKAPPLVLMRGFGLATIKEMGTPVAYGAALVSSEMMESAALQAALYGNSYIKITPQWTEVIDNVDIRA